MDEVINQHKEDADKTELLFWACARGLLPDVRELITQGADPSARSKDGSRPLHFASCHGHLHVAEYLLSRGADLEAEDLRGRTALHYAAAGGHLEVVRALVGRGSWMDCYDAVDDTALHLASRHGHVPCVSFLSSSGAKLNLPNKRSLTPLAEALCGGQVEAAKTLLAAGAKADIPLRGFTLLHLVCGLGQAPSARLLLTHRPPLIPQVDEAGNEEGLTPLHAAAMNGSAECAELLLSHGANPAALSAAGQLPQELLPAGEQHARLRRALEAAAAKKGAKPKKAVAAAAPAAAGSGGPEKGGAGSSSKGRVQGEKEEDGAGEVPFSKKFAGMTQLEQERKVDSLSRLEEAELAGLPYLSKEGREALLKLRRAVQVLEGFKALAALRLDPEFQEDVVHPAVVAAMEDIKKTNEVDRYATHSRLQSVMTKMNRLQGVLKQNGNLKISLDDLKLTAKGPNSATETRRRLMTLQEAVSDARDVAVVVLQGKDIKAATQEKERQAAQEMQTLTSDARAGTSPEGLEPGGSRVAPWRLWLWSVAVEFGVQMMRSGGLMVVVLLTMWLAGLMPGQNKALVQKAQEMAARAAAAAAAAAAAQDGAAAPAGAGAAAVGAGVLEGMEEAGGPGGPAAQQEL